MKIYDLKFDENEQYYKFYLVTNDNTCIKVCVYLDTEVFIINSDLGRLNENKGKGLYEIIFNNDFIDAILKADVHAFKFNEEKYIKIFEEFQSQVKLMII